VGPPSLTLHVTGRRQGTREEGWIAPGSHPNPEVVVHHVVQGWVQPSRGIVCGAAEKTLPLAYLVQDGQPLMVRGAGVDFPDRVTFHVDVAYLAVNDPRRGTSRNRSTTLESVPGSRVSSEFSQERISPRPYRIL